MIVLVRALTYAALFIGLVLIFLPARILTEAGVRAPENVGALEVLGILVGTIGACLAIWCVLAFAVVGKGTPAPFDPPRRLVVRGPYKVVRNPMYLGAGLALGGAALYYQSGALAMFGLVFLFVTHVFVRLYEEPTLRRTFGEDYERYSRRVGRWLPKV